MKLISYSYSSSGGMMGGHSSVYISYDKDGRCYVEDISKVTHNSPTYTTHYYAKNLLDELSVVCDKHNVRSWTNLPDNEIVMLDGDTHSYSFNFEDGLSIRLGSKKQTPDNWRDFWNEVSALLEDAEEHAINKTTKKEENKPVMFGFMNNVSMSEVQQTKRDISDKPKYCSMCGSKFDNDTQKFCPNCGAVRK